jgi:hypothetical protein
MCCVTVSAEYFWAWRESVFKNVFIVVAISFFCSANAIAVDLEGLVTTTGGARVCALVLASGRTTFSCNPSGPFKLVGLPTEPDGSIKLQVYADGFLPYAETIRDFSFQNVVMTRAGSCPVDDGLSDTSPLDGTYSLLRDTNYFDYDYPFVLDSASQDFQASGTLNISGDRYAIDVTLVLNGQSEFLSGSGTLREDGIFLIFDEFTSDVSAQIVIERGGKLTLFENLTGNGDDFAFVWSFKKLSSTSAVRSMAIPSDSAPLTMNTLIDVLVESAALEVRAKMSDE